MGDDKMHGEGNPEADREYRKGATKFAGTKEQKKAADDARRAIEGDEADELTRASEKARQKGGKTS